MNKVKISSRRRKYADEVYESLSNSLLFDQIKTVLVNLRLDLAGISNKENALEKLDKASLDLNAKIKAMYEIESQTPFKHCYVIKYSGDLPSSFSKIKFTNNNEKLKLKITYNSSNSHEHVITFEHKVIVKDWVKISSDGRKKELVDTPIRHPLIVKFLLDEKLFLISYPGFNQGLATPKADRIKYESIVKCITDFLSENYSINFMSFPTGNSINNLEDAKSDRFINVNVNTQTSEGKIQLSSYGTSLSVSEYLASKLFPHSKDKDKATLATVIKNALRETSHNSVVLYWKLEEVFTRISFWESGSEFLFIWNGKEATYSKVYSIFKILNSVYQYEENNQRKNIWDHICGKSQDDIFLISSLSSSYSLNKEEILDVIGTALSAGIIIPVYRLNTDFIIQNLNNNWTEKVSSLSQKFILENGKKIDGRDLNNIEVGFKRVENKGLPFE